MQMIGTEKTETTKIQSICYLVALNIILVKATTGLDFHSRSQRLTDHIKKVYNVVIRSIIKVVIIPN